MIGIEAPEASLRIGSSQTSGLRSQREKEGVELSTRRAAQGSGKQSNKHMKQTGRPVTSVAMRNGRARPPRSLCATFYDLFGQAAFAAKSDTSEQQILLSKAKL